MTITTHHLSIDELEARVRGSSDVVERNHCQAIWLLAKGHTTAEVAEVMALTPRWVNKLARRYERDGATALGDQRRRNPGGKPLLSAADLEALRERLRRPPDDGGLWTGPKVARWIAARRGLAHVHPPRGWEALKKLNWSLQEPRPKNPKSATPEEEAAFKKSSPTRWPRKPASMPISRSRSGRRMSIGSA
jgi:transposase